MEVAIETNALASTKVKNKNKMSDSLALSNQNDVEQQKENATNQNTLKATPTSLKKTGNTGRLQRETRGARV